MAEDKNSPSKEPANKAKAKAKPEAEAKLKAKPKAPAGPEAKAKAKPEAEAKLEAKAEAEPQAPAKLEAKAEAEPKAEAKAPTGPEAKAEAEPKAEAQAPTGPEAKAKTEPDNSVKLEGLFAFKMSMATFYNDKGESLPVTALKYEPAYVSQIKNKEKESYSAIQVAFKAQKNKRCSKAVISHLKPAGFKEGARFVREIRQTVSKNIKPGQKVSIESLKKGDLVKISSLSKGRGFAGVMKRWNFAGGKASHGSKSHRRTGSIGQHTEPARVMPGRKMPGRYGFEKTSRLKVPVVDVLPEEGIIFVKGPVPGARNTLVSLRKMN